jgi:ribonuclease-3
MTHRSFAFEEHLEEDNERLEFLGDAIIGAVASEYLFGNDSEADEGVLSKRRSRLVSRSALGRRAQAMGLGGLILLGKGERDSGGMHRLSTLGSVLEALVGVVYLNLGHQPAWKFVREHILQSLVEDERYQLFEGDAKSELQEWTQQHFRIVPVYHLITEEGPAHKRSFLVEVEVQGKLLARGSGSRIKNAEGEAARKALLMIRRNEAADRDPLS